MPCAQPLPQEVTLSSYTGQHTAQPWALEADSVAPKAVQYTNNLEKLALHKRWRVSLLMKCVKTRIPCFSIIYAMSASPTLNLK